MLKILSCNIYIIYYNRMIKTQKDNLDPKDYITPKNNPYFIGNKKALSIFANLLKKDHFPHSWMITGPKGIGKATMVYRFVRYLLSGEYITHYNQNLFLSASHPTFKRVAGGSHSDLIVVEKKIDPKTGKKNKVITVEDIRSINAFMQLTSSETNKKIVIIDSISDMNVNAANAVLKVLEEPPKNSFFFLINHDVEDVLPTINSRCLNINFTNLLREEAFEVLSFVMPEVSDQEKDTLIRISSNSPGKALAIYKNNGIEIYKNIKKAFIGISNHKYDNFHLLGDLIGNSEEDKEKWLLITDFLLKFIFESIKVKSTNIDVQNFIFPDIKKDAALFIESKSIEDLFSIFDKASILVKETDRLNLDRKTILLNILFLLKS